MKKVKVMIPEQYVDKELQKLYIEERREQIYQQIVKKRKIREYQKKIRSVNTMLRALKETDYYNESIAVENLFNYVTSPSVGLQQTEKGYLSVKGLKNMTNTQFTDK